MVLSAALNDPVFSEHSASTFSPVVLRQAYALAIIRLVNGLVDPLQQGVYARPISSIAAQIGLPSWLVELRHAATHEDLPSMHLLREAATQVEFSENNEFPFG
jgi:ribosomal biogenesis protein LAS1